MDTTKSAAHLTLTDGTRIACPEHPEAGVWRDRREVKCCQCGGRLWNIPEDEPWAYWLEGTNDATLLGAIPSARTPD